MIGPYKGSIFLLLDLHNLYISITNHWYFKKVLFTIMTMNEN